MTEPTTDPPREPEPSPGMQLASSVMDDLCRAGNLLYRERWLCATQHRIWLSFAEAFVVWLEELEK